MLLAWKLLLVKFAIMRGLADGLLGRMEATANAGRVVAAGPGVCACAALDAIAAKAAMSVAAAMKLLFEVNEWRAGFVIDPMCPCRGGFVRLPTYTTAQGEMFNKGVFNSNPGDGLAGVHVLGQNHLRSGLERRRVEIRDHGALPCLPGGLRRGADRASAPALGISPAALGCIGNEREVFDAWLFIQSMDVSIG
jgi:hypothetical protein